MVWRSCLDTPISSSILALVFLIVHEMRSMRLQHHISKAAILLRSGLFRVQVSETYKAIGNTRAWTSLTLVVLLIPLSAQILDRFVIAERAIANRCLISWLQPSSLVIRDPRKLNLETDSTSLPSIMRGPSTLSGLEVQKLIWTCPVHARSHQNFVVSLTITFKNSLWFTVPHGFFFVCPVHSRSHRILASPACLSQPTCLVPYGHGNFVPGSPVTEVGKLQIECNRLSFPSK